MQPCSTARRACAASKPDQAENAPSREEPGADPDQQGALTINAVDLFLDAGGQERRRPSHHLLGEKRIPRGPLGDDRRQLVLYIAISFGLFMGTLIFQFVLWGVVGTVAAIAATAFLTRTKGS